MTTFTTVKDSVTFTLNEADLTQKNHELKWYTQWYPAGSPENPNDIYVFLNTEQTVGARMILSAAGCNEKWPTKKPSGEENVSNGWIQFLRKSHKEIRPLFKNGKLTITCDVEFDISVPFSDLLTPQIFDCDHLSPDLELIVGSHRLPTHKTFLSLISPVFYAMFSHDTIETRSGKVEITDFEFSTVKAAIDFCYGRKLENASVENAVNILRFADKYDIKAIVTPLEQIPINFLSKENFCTVILYAYDCSRKKMLKQCGSFYRDHADEIKTMETFSQLPQPLIITLLKSAFNLTTNFSVLHHAHVNELGFVVDYLEQPLLNSLTLDDFCLTVTYAWERSRDDLKKVCAKFLNDNRVEATTLEEFADLPSQALRELLKLSLTI